MTPQEFAEKMEEIANRPDSESSHYCADQLMADLLNDLGYSKGVEIYNNMEKWYS